MKIKKIILNVLLLFIILICIFPFLYMFLMSFRSTMNMHDIRFDMRLLTLEHYKAIFSNSLFLNAFKNSVFVAISGVVLTEIVSLMAGYAFSRQHFTGKNVLFKFVVVTMLVPGQAILIPLYLVIRGLGWVNTFKALILPLPTAFGVLLMRQAIESLPKELIESAQIDGASEKTILLKIITPLIHSEMITVAIVTFIGAWNNFLWPLIVSTREEMWTLPLMLTTMQAQDNTDVGLLMACSVITFLPPFIFYISMQSRFKEGIALSGVKG